MILSRPFSVTSGTVIMVFGPFYFIPQFLTAFATIESIVSQKFLRLEASIITGSSNVTIDMLRAGDRLLGGPAGLFQLPIGISSQGGSPEISTGFVSPLRIDARDVMQKYIGVAVQESNAATIEGWVSIS